MKKLALAAATLLAATSFARPLATRVIQPACAPDEKGAYASFDRMLADLGRCDAKLDVTSDPAKKYLKPAGCGNLPAKHPSCCEIGRRPWQYRPAGPAIVPPLAEAPMKRLCAHRGFSAVAPENSLPAYGAAIALGAAEIEFDIWWTKDGECVSIHDPTVDRISNGSGKVTEMTYAELAALDFGEKQKGPHFRGLRIARFSDILVKFSSQTIFNIHVKMNPGEAKLRELVEMIRAYDASKHSYFMTESEELHLTFAKIAPDMARCLGSCGRRDFLQQVRDAKRFGCFAVQLWSPTLDREMVKSAHAAGLRVNVFWSDKPDEAKKFLDWGVDTILTNDYLPIATATGLR